MTGWFENVRGRLSENIGNGEDMSRRGTADNRRQDLFTNVKNAC